MQTAPDETLAQAEYDRFVERNLKRNYAANYAHGMLGLTGFRVINAPTFLPAYLHAVSGSSAIVGLGVALQQVGMIVSPILSANFIEHRRKVLPAVVWVGGLARVQILGLAAAGWLLSGEALTIGLLLFIALFGVFQGAQGVVGQLLISKVIPISRRGRLQAWRNATGGVIAAGLSYLAGRYLIDTRALGNGYSTTFLLAAILTTIGILVLQFAIREPESVSVREPTPLLQRLREFPHLLSADRGYAMFVAAQCLASLARLAVPFYVLFASTGSGLTGNELGLLSFAYLGADTLCNLLWGYMGDRLGFRSVMLGTIAMWIGATAVLLWSSGSTWLMLVAFFGLGGSQAGYMMGSQTMILEFGSRRELPMRMALSATASGLAGAIGPLAGGVIAAAAGYVPIFWLSIVLLAASLAVIITRVPDPRHRAGAI